MTNNMRILRGKTVLITGGTGGIGKETALELARLGARLVITGRDRVRGEAAVADIKRASGNEQLDLLLADLSNQTEIRGLAQTFLNKYPRLDVLINNLGGLYPNRWETVDGIEAILAVNHLSPFLLTYLLLPALKASTPARIINVTGGMPNAAKINLTNLQAEQSFLGLETYSQAKVVMMAGAYELAQRLKGTGITLNVAYPGAAATSMTAAMTPAMVPWYMRAIWPVFRLMLKKATPVKAARSSIYLASSDEVEGLSGNYYDSNSRRAKWPKSVMNAEIRQHIWQLSHQLTSLNSELVIAS